LNGIHYITFSRSRQALFALGTRQARGTEGWDGPW
jgi:hypothetical protein